MLDSKSILGFNPCFIGSIFQTRLPESDTPPPFFCFNPCFIGSIFQTWFSFYWKGDIILVSILVLLEVSFRLMGALSEWTWSGVFQSLFYWKYLSDAQRCYFIFHWINSFNPCFIGSIFQTNSSMPSSFAFFAFQSLFYWKYLSDIHMGKSYRKEVRVSILVLLEVSFRPFLLPFYGRLYFSFNPCFIGSIFQTRALRLSGISSMRCFNPCFIGSIFQTQLCIIHVSPIAMFQSLFYWKYLSDKTYSTTSNMRR